MALSDRQIERYSRQIIAIGGIAQERLLAARITIAGEAADVEPVLDFLAGAGVGRINLCVIGETLNTARLVGRAHEINADVVTDAAKLIDESAGAALLILAGTIASLAQGETLCLSDERSPTVFARLDRPAKVVTLPTPPPYPACVAAKLFAPISPRSEAAGIATMAAAVEALKLLFAELSELHSSIMEFARYENPTRPLHR